MPKVRSLLGLAKFMRGNILVLTITRTLGMFCRSMVFPYASLYILALGGEPAQIGFVNSLSPLAGLIMFPLGGYLADRAGRVRLVALGGYLSSAILLLYILAPNWQAIAVARLLYGFLVFQFPPTSAIIADSLSPEHRATGVATMNTISGLFAIVAPYLAGTLIDAHGARTGIRVQYGVMAVTYAANATINLRFLQETSSRSEKRLGLSDLLHTLKSAYAGIPTTLRQMSRSLKTLGAVIILAFTSNAVASSFWVVYARDHIGLSSSEWGLILLIETTMRSLMYVPAGMVVDRLGRAGCILGSLLISLVSVPMFVFSRDFVHVLLIRAAIAVATALSIPACSALMADCVSRNMRGRVMAAIGRGTLMIGAASGGERAGLAWAFWPPYR